MNEHNEIENLRIANDNLKFIDDLNQKTIEIYKNLVATLKLQNKGLQEMNLNLYERILATKIAAETLLDAMDNPQPEKQDSF